MQSEETTLQRFGRNFTKGTVLFREGDLSKEMYVIHAGKVKIKKQVGDMEKTLAVLIPGDFFGEMATLLDRSRSATAEVMEDSTLIVVDPQAVETMIVNNAGIALKIIKKLASRILEANDKIAYLMLKDNTSRIVHVLMRMAEAGGVREGDSVMIHITPKELAREADMDVYEVKDLMEKLSEANVVTLEELAIRINSIHKLKFFDFLAIKKESGRV